MAGQGQQWEKSLNFVKDHIFTVFTRQFSADQSVRWAVGQSIRLAVSPSQLLLKRLHEFHCSCPSAHEKCCLKSGLICLQYEKQER